MTHPLPHLVAAAALCLGTAAFAAGTSTPLPPSPTETTQVCKDGQVFDEVTQSCVLIQDSSLDTDQQFQAVRELAYAGRYGDSLSVLAMMSEGDSDRVLTYLGFNHRRMGDVDRGMAYYQQALTLNPDNLLARSYMGQGLVEAGDLLGAKAQLREIRARGGRQTWAELSLRQAIASGRGYAY